jgi:hypothetical protein
VCSLCGTLAAGPHWADGTADRRQVGARRSALRGRLVRAALLDRVLSPFGLRVEEWEETAYVLRSATGETVLAADLTSLLAEAERLARRPLDPLDPAYLARLGA